MDALSGTKRQADSSEGLRAIVNAGNRRGTTVPRMVGEGKRMRVQDLSTFGPKVLLGIARRPLRGRLGAAARELAYGTG